MERPSRASRDWLRRGSPRSRDLCRPRSSYWRERRIVAGLRRPREMDRVHDVLLPELGQAARRRLPIEARDQRSDVLLVLEQAAGGRFGVGRPGDRGDDVCGSGGHRGPQLPQRASNRFIDVPMTDLLSPRPSAVGVRRGLRGVLSLITTTVTETVRGCQGSSACTLEPGCILSRPMTTTRRPDSPARERAHELIRAWDGRPGPLGSLLGRVTAVDQVGVEAARRRAQAPLDQEGVEALGARPRDPDDGSDDARGEGHAGQGPGDVRQGDAPAAGRPDDPVGRRGVRLPRARRRGEGRPHAARPSRSPASPPASRPARRSATSRSPRRGRRSRPAPTRSTWSSTAARSCPATT